MILTLDNRRADRYLVSHSPPTICDDKHFISLIFDGFFSQEWHHHFAGLIITYHLLM